MDNPCGQRGPNHSHHTIADCIAEATIPAILDGYGQDFLEEPMRVCAQNIVEKMSIERLADLIGEPMVRIIAQKHIGELFEEARRR